MSSPSGGSAPALEAARRDLVRMSTELLDLQADTGSPVSQRALDAAVERLALRLLRVSDRLGHGVRQDDDAR